MKFDGKRLRDLRESKKLTLEDLSEVIGKSRQTLSNWEKGKHEPSLDEVTRLGSALGVPGMFFIVQGTKGE